MNRMTLSALALVSAAVLAGPAVAADAPAGKTREQVKAELAEAIRLGDMPADSETGRKLNEVYPHLYPKKAASAGKTREQVKAELAEAIRLGDMPADSETGRKLNEVYPHLYPKKAAPVAKTRQQVKDELSRALRDGTMPVYEGA